MSLLTYDPDTDNNVGGVDGGVPEVDVLYDGGLVASCNLLCVHQPQRTHECVVTDAPAHAGQLARGEGDNHAHKYEVRPYSGCELDEGIGHKFLYLRSTILAVLVLNF